jgi:DNA topoisomerase-2
MHLFDGDCKLHKYSKIEDIINAFYQVRIEMYGKRKSALISSLREVLKKLSNRARYIQDLLSDTIDLRKKTNRQVHDLLVSLAYDAMDGDYKYLIKMPMDSVTEEHVEKIMKEKEETERELEVLIGTTLEQMWLNDLDKFETEYEKYRLKRKALTTTTTSTKKAKK